MAKFSINNNNSVFIKLSPFINLKGLHPCMSFDVIDLLNSTTRKRINNKKAIDIIKAIQST